MITKLAKLEVITVSIGSVLLLTGAFVGSDLLAVIGGGFIAFSIVSASVGVITQ